MNKYNNFSRVPVSDPPLRFNKRSRFSGCNNSPRFKHQNQTGHQFTPNRNNATDGYQHNQYEKSPNRYFYGNSPKRSNYHQTPSNKETTPHLHKSSISSSLSPSCSTYSGNAQSGMPISTSQSNRLSAQTSPTVAEQNNQHQQIYRPNILDSSNYYGYSYNFYPASYNSDIIPTASGTAFGAADSMTPYMWQTIKSTPPPKLPLHQPPLPQQQPPPLPPLPTSDKMPHLPPPPPIPLSISDSPSEFATKERADESSKLLGQDSGEKTVIKMKAKRKAMSTRYKLSKSWTESDAKLALKTEETNTRKLQNDVVLIIRFPDPEISREMIKSYSPNIESVHFQLNAAPRYCLVHLKSGVNIEKTIDDLSKIKFGTGYLSVEIKEIPNKAPSRKLNEIDPFTLYVGNLPTTIACKTLKEHFPGAARIDIGFAQRMKYTRYAFIRYQSVHKAIEAYKRMLDVEIGGRTLTIRFRRLTSATEGSKEVEVENNDFVNQETEALENNLNELVQTNCENAEPVGRLEEENNNVDIAENVSDLPLISRKNITESAKNTENQPAQENVPTKVNLVKTKEDTSSQINPTRYKKSIQEKSNTLLNNIKPDLDHDPDDVVVRDYTSTCLSENFNNTIKQEEDKLIYTEFFERPRIQNGTCERTSKSDRNSLTSVTDETDTISQASSNSLGEFLEICQRQNSLEYKKNEDSEPPTKRNKTAIKKTSLETSNIANMDGLCVVKQEGASRDSENFNSSAPNIQLNRKKAATTNNSKDFHNITTYGDDIVPPTALFFTNNDHNNLISSENICNKSDLFYNEFYETRVSSSQALTSHVNVKTESLDISNGKSTKEINKKIKENKRFNQSNTESNNVYQDIEKSKKNSTTTCNNIEDDDLVPAQNLLGLYRPSNDGIKQETEHDEFFSVPFRENNVVKEALKQNSDSNLPSQTNNCEIISEAVERNVTEDDDVIIISANIPEASKSVNSVRNNSFIPTLNDLVSFHYKPTSLAIFNREVSTFLNEYHLDKLYQQLDEDSGSEL